MKISRFEVTPLTMILAVCGSVGISNWRHNQTLEATHEVGVLQTQLGEPIASVSVGSGPALILADPGQGVIRTAAGSTFYRASKIGTVNLVNLNAPDADKQIRDTLCASDKIDCGALIAQATSATRTSQFSVRVK